MKYKNGFAVIVTISCLYDYSLMFIQVLIFKRPVDLFIDAALRFLDRIAEELALPMKKIEVCQWLELNLCRNYSFALVQYK